MHAAPGYGIRSADQHRAPLALISFTHVGAHDGGAPGLDSWAMMVMVLTTMMNPW